MTDKQIVEVLKFSLEHIQKEQKDSLYCPGLCTLFRDFSEKIAGTRISPKIVIPNFKEVCKYFEGNLSNVFYWRTGKTPSYDPFMPRIQVLECLINIVEKKINIESKNRPKHIKRNSNKWNEV